ncbi:MAG: hypothetical protein LBL75_00115 [Rickettsiales bacterium]|jgi:hypothetical protein|nr:hypothetical protein [Rickettsiales bacterium]
MIKIVKKIQDYLEVQKELSCIKKEKKELLSEISRCEFIKLDTFNKYKNNPENYRKTFYPYICNLRITSYPEQKFNEYTGEMGYKPDSFGSFEVSCNNFQSTTNCSDCVSCDEKDDYFDTLDNLKIAKDKVRACRRQIFKIM